MKAVVVLLLGLCASAYGMFDMVEEVAPKPCCTPQQWEGYFGENTAYYSYRRHHPGAVFVGGKMSYDAKSKKVAISMAIDGKYNVKVIADFSQQKRYLIYSNGTKCKVSKTSRAFKPCCIPKTAKFMGSFFQGAGAAKLAENAWAMKGKRFGVWFTTTKTGCIPVGESVVGSARGTLIDSNIGYSNITPGIKNPNVFKPPKSCKQLDEEDHYFGEEYPILEYLTEKFHQE